MIIKVNDILNEIERYKPEGKPPLGEFRIHPEDYEALKRDARPFLSKPAPEVPNSIAGIKIVVDSAAPRLPRYPY